MIDKHGTEIAVGDPVLVHRKAKPPLMGKVEKFGALYAYVRTVSAWGRPGGLYPANPDQLEVIKPDA